MPHIRIEITRNFIEVRPITGSLLIGRGEEADILLLHRSVSRRHARIYGGQGGYYVTDLGSSNGIKVNGKLAGTSRLAHGDTIEVGQRRLFFIDEELGAPEAIVDLSLRTSEEEHSLDPLATCNDVVVRFLSDEASVQRISQAVMSRFEALGLDPAENMNLETALNEGVGNAVRHGHQYDPEKIVEVRIVWSPERLLIRVTDEGPGFDYRAMLKRGMELDAASAARERYQEGGMGGLGILMMLRCMDQVQYNASGNELTLTKFLTEEARRAADLSEEEEELVPELLDEDGPLPIELDETQQE